MSKTVLETENVSDISAAIISMDGVRKSEGDRPVFDLSNLPLPIIHKDFQFSARQIAASRNGGSPLDTTAAELAGRRVAEAVDALTIGNLTAYKFGGGYVYGLRNFPRALPKVITSPEASGWTPATLVQETLEMRSQSQGAYHYGPWMLYCSPDWDAYMDDDYSSQKGDLTLRDRLKKIEGIEGVVTLDTLPDYDLLLVQLTSDVIRMVVGMDVVTVQWPSEGGMLMNYKVMCIIVPQLRADHNGNTGIVYGKPT
jgi:uncharacterized linocin/CFP29 family protein